MTFVKTFWASLLAQLFAGLIVVFGVLFISIFMVAGLVGYVGQDNVKPLNSDVVLKIDFSDKIVENYETTPQKSFDLSSFKLSKTVSLVDFITALEYAAIDDNIKGIYLDFSQPQSMSFARAEEIRAALENFKKSNKFVVAYSETYSQGAYYIASVADELYLNPEGGLQWQGLASTQLFYKGLLDKLGIEPIAVRSGEYKSAIEPFVRTSMSAENKDQTTILLNSLWNTMLDQISSSRDIKTSRLKDYAQELAVVYPEDALRLSFVDGLKYEDNMYEVLCELMGEEDKDDAPDFVGLANYAALSKMQLVKSKDKIAIVYLDGEITSGKSSQDGVGSKTLRKKLEKVRDDDDVKALVLRVNSPGGSALASEVIWRELELVKKEMPVVVSFGGIAASGGYYAAVASDAIVANKMSITGSIGVFSLMFNAERGLQNKLGITSEEVGTSQWSSMGSALRSPSVEELNYAQNQVDKVYATFVERVADGRNITKQQALALAGGRVYSGEEAAKNGLVDAIGSLSQAVVFASKKADIQGSYQLVQYVEPLDNFMALVNLFSTQLTLEQLWAKKAENVEKLLKKGGVQALHPYNYEL